MTDQAPAAPGPATPATATLGLTMPPMPTTAADAGAMLAQLGADPQFAAKILANSPAEVQRMRDLVALKIGRPADPNLDLLMNGTGESQPFVATGESGLTPQDLVGSIVTFREAGLSDGSIREAVAGSPVSKAEQDAVKRLYADKISDAGWRDRLLKGGAVERRELILMRVVLGAPLKHGS